MMKLLEKLRAENDALKEEIRFLEKQANILWIALAVTSVGFAWLLGMVLR